MTSHVGEALERHMAELDFQFKRHAHALDELIEGVGELKGQLEDSHSTANQ